MTNLYEAQVGDTLYVRYVGITQVRVEPVTVIKVTATQVTTSDRRRFFKRNGWCVGEGKKRCGFHFLETVDNSKEV